MSTVAEHYRALRANRPTTPARYVIDWARDAIKVDAIAHEIEWDNSDWSRLIGVLPDGVSIVVHDDDEPYDWGDIEPADDERESLEVIGIEVLMPDGSGVPQRCMTGDGKTFVLDCSLWSIGYNGYRTDARREAIRTAVEHGFFDAAQAEITEHAYWAARDVPTVETV